MRESFGASEIPLLLMSFSLFRKTDTRVTAGFSMIKNFLVGSLICAENTVRWGVWLERHMY